MHISTNAKKSRLRAKSFERYSQRVVQEIEGMPMNAPHIPAPPLPSSNVGLSRVKPNWQNPIPQKNAGAQLLISSRNIIHISIIILALWPHLHPRSLPSPRSIHFAYFSPPAPHSPPWFHLQLPDHLSLSLILRAAFLLLPTGTESGGRVLSSRLGWWRGRRGVGFLWRRGKGLGVRGTVVVVEGYGD